MRQPMQYSKICNECRKGIAMVGQVQDRPGETSQASGNLAKKPYRRPVLSNLGTLRDLTMATSGGSHDDGRTTMRGTPLKTGRGGLNGRGRQQA